VKRKKKLKMPLRLLGHRAADLLGIVVARGGKVPGWNVKRKARYGKKR
jgi:hypothetical protein